jgi:predicted DNA-binding protein (MmcQ/YjbR family)
MNNYKWIDSYCLAKTGVIKDYQDEWQAHRYLIGGKMFAMQGNDKVGKAIITLKLEPAFGLSLRQEYSDIVAGYYMNKEHWNSLYLEGNVPSEVVKIMIDESYQLVLKTLTKKLQKELLG